MKDYAKLIQTAKTEYRTVEGKSDESDAACKILHVACRKKDDELQNLLREAVREHVDQSIKVGEGGYRYLLTPTHFVLMNTEAKRVTDDDYIKFIPLKKEVKKKVTK